MNEKGYFISHTDGLVVAYLVYANDGFAIEELLIDEEGWFTLQYKKKKTVRVSHTGLLSDPHLIIEAIFNPDKDSWSYKDDWS